MFPGIDYIKTVINGILFRISNLSKEINKKISDATVDIKSYVTSLLAKSTADWNQNDQDATDYVKNRTHWKETVPVTHYEYDGEFTINDTDTAAYVLDNLIRLKAGVTYKVTYDGKEYVLTSVEMNHGVGLGNLALQDRVSKKPECYVQGEDTGESFAIIDSDYYSPKLHCIVDSAGYHSVCLDSEETKAVYHQLDSNYVPDDIARSSDVVTKNNPVFTGNISLGRFGSSGTGSSAIGYNVTASGSYSHAEGFGTTASGKYSHAEGTNTKASGDYSHAEGYNVTASGSYSHAEGYQTKASGDYSHAEGNATEASGDYSHAEGKNTNAASSYQHVQGVRNLIDSSGKYCHIVGNGSATDNIFSNAHTLDWNGNAWFAGDVYVGSISGTNKDDGSKKLATEKYVDDYAIPIPSTAEVGQTIKVKAIDENGKPTEWEPCDFPEQVQSDYGQSDTLQPDFVKNRPFYAVENIKLNFGYRENFGDFYYHTEVSIADVYNQLYAVEINGAKFSPVQFSGDTSYDCIGDADMSIWSGGGGVGYQITYSNASRDWIAHIDEARFGEMSDAVVTVYSLEVKKKLPSQFLQKATDNLFGGIKAYSLDNVDSTFYNECAVNDEGYIFSKFVPPVVFYSELSITNLLDLTDKINSTGSHGIFTDSVADNIGEEISLPCHAYYYGIDTPSYAAKFIIESADGKIILLKCKGSGVTGISVLAQIPSAQTNLIVTASPNEEGMLVASHTSTEIYEAINNGKSVVLLFGGLAISLGVSDSDSSLFIGFIDGGLLNIYVDGNGKIELTSSTTLYATPCEVGQVFRVLAVDDNGFPAEWEAFDPFVIQSSTEGSTKKFKLSVDDNGTISATEVMT